MDNFKLEKPLPQLAFILFYNPFAVPFILTYLWSIIIFVNSRKATSYL